MCSSLQLHTFFLFMLCKYSSNQITIKNFFACQYHLLHDRQRGMSCQHCLDVTFIVISGLYLAVGNSMVMKNLQSDC